MSITEQRLRAKATDGYDDRLPIRRSEPDAQITGGERVGISRTSHLSY